MLRRFVVFAVCLGIITAVPLVGHACKCDDLPSVEQELAESKAVFTGKVIEIKEEKKFSSGSTIEKVLFEVQETWKGPSDSHVILESSQTSCSIIFKKGEEYLVYAKQNPDFKNKTVYTSQLCDRTVEAAKAGEDFRVLGKGEPPVKAVNLEKGMEWSIFVLPLLIWTPVIGVAGLIGFFIWKGAKD
ncbi:hypothetical protein [Bacillus sp. FJAT-27445]|uniref:hypothetical protein n=1 Tax=Bacillus sp. FJAT-27445 TaxID=1679166 RepID=UPI000743C03F|nr:hypothetical protein [Bacillus sp. FJAT-27445]